MNFFKKLFRRFPNTTTAADTTNIASTGKKDKKSQYTNWKKSTIWTAFFIAATTFFSFFLFYLTHKKVIANIKPFTVFWAKNDSVHLKTGPEWFYYDKKKGTVNSLRTITEKEKSLLTELLSKDENIYSSYSQAIDELAYDSNRDISKANYCWILLLYCIAGMIGVQLRTINNFVGNTCYKKEFDFAIWWPWYFLRPLIGFITGGVVFLIIDGKLFSTEQASGSISAVILALAFVGGFSADDFYDMLRRISKRVFSTNTNSNGSEANENKADDSESEV